MVIKQLDQIIEKEVLLLSKLRFRAWDDKRNKWIDEADLLMECNGRVWAGDINNPPMVEIDSKFVNFSLGLKDNKGNEVFEGDILKPIVEGTVLGGKVYEGFKGYQKEYFLQDIREVSENLRKDISKLEVIGHIYESN